MAHPQTRGLKHEAQRKLNMTLRVRLGGRDLAKGRVALFYVETTVALVPLLRRIGHIESFCSELHLEPLRERKIFKQGNIYTSLARVVVALQAQRSRRARSRRHHRRSVKPRLRSPAARRGVLGVLSRNQIGHAVPECADALRGPNRERRASTERRDAVELPVADQPTGGTGVAEPAPTSAERQIVDKAGHKVVPDVPGCARIACCEVAPVL